MALFDINLTPPQELDLNFSPHTPEEEEQAAHIPEEEEQAAHIAEEEEQEHAAEPDHIAEEEDQEHAVQRHHKDLPESSKFAAYIALKALGKDRPVVKADKEIVAQLLGISLRSVEKIWKKAIDQESRNEVPDFSNKRKGRCGRKRREINLDERVPKVELNKRGTSRGLARSLDIPFATLQRRLAWGDLRRHTNSLKPHLSLENRIRRLIYCISMVDETTILEAKLSFIKMGNILHMDEKWFDMTKRDRTYYLTREEPEPVRTIHNKNSIGKVMFLTVVARPRHDARGHVIVDNDTFIAAKEYGTWLNDPSSIIRPRRRVKKVLRETPRRRKLDLIRETQIGEFEASIQPIIEEEKPEEKKRIKRRRGGEDEGQYKKPRKAQEEKPKHEKRKGKQPIIEEEKPEKKKRIKRRRGGEDEASHPKLAGI